MDKSPQTQSSKDTLQTFLILSVILLIALYALESWRRSLVEEGFEKANRWTQMIDPCIVHSSGLKGDFFTFECPQSPLREIELEVRQTFKLKTFAIRLSNQTYYCTASCVKKTSSKRK